MVKIAVCDDSDFMRSETKKYILKKYKFAAGLDEPLLKYRMSSSSKSGNKLKSARMTFGVYRHMGYSWLACCYYFVCYCIHGVLKYL